MDECCKNENSCTQSNDCTQKNIVINLVSGMSYMATNADDELINNLFNVLQNQDNNFFILNGQWFNKSAVASVYVELKKDA